jgi:tyrosyl-tRNA synthetase
VDIYDVYEERGFIAQSTDEKGLRDLFNSERVTAYIGFDPSADSLHVGSMVPIMSLAHLQRAGHRPIGLVGGGTGMVGDPSGKTEMRKILSREDINNNAEGIKKQLSRFIDFSDEKALMLNNADWLCEFNYIDFLRDIGRHFTINRMLTMESVKQRLDSETGMSFIEFNYMLLQAYDFYHQCVNYGCKLQMGGNDQWGNITAGIDLTRRMGGPQVYGLTFPLIQTASGAKMGKTADGAIWLDANRTSPYDFYQFWRNTEDADVVRFLKLFTFLEMDEIRDLAKLQGAEINRAKEVLAYEATKLTHGQNEADKARSAAQAAFSGKGKEDDIPTFSIERGELDQMAAFQLFVKSGLCQSGGDARRLIKQGGAYVNDEKVKAFDQLVTELIKSDDALLRAGKKRYKRLTVIS